MGKVIGFLMGDFLKSNKLLIIIYSILNLILYPINSIYVPRLYSELISKVGDLKKSLSASSTGKNSTPGKVPFPHLSNFSNYSSLPIPNLIIFIITISIVVSIIFRIKYYIYAIIFPKYKMWLREKIFSKTLEKRNTDFEEQKVGKEIMRIEDIIFTMKEIFNFLIVDCSELLLISALIIGYLYTLDSRIALYAFLQIVIIGIFIWLTHERIKQSTLNKTDSYYSIADNIDNSFNNLSNVLINNQTTKEVKKNHKHSKVYKYDSQKSNNILNNLSILIRILTLVFFALILFQGYKLTLKKQITATNFTTIVILLLHFQGYLYGQAWALSATIDRSWQIKYNDEYLVDLLSPDTKGKNLKNVIDKGKIEFRNVYYQYKQANTPVLQNLNLTIKPQEKVAIMGKSGSGKSTLVKLLIKLYSFDLTNQTSPNIQTPQKEFLKKQKNSLILIDGIPHTDINTQYLRHKVNYVNQNTLLFDEDIYYNIKYGNKRDSQYNFMAPSPTNLPENQTATDETQQNHKIEQMLKKYDLLTIYDNLEKGLLSKAGPKGTNLSLGMQKITILMRGLMRDSQIIIFDEPLAGLDQKTREKVINLITKETREKTVLVITHDPEILPHLDRTVYLHEIQDTNGKPPNTPNTNNHRFPSF